MIKNIKDGDTFVDIGANIGIYTNFIPQLVWEKWKVIAFEPISKIYNQNMKSIQANKYTNVTLYNLACSNKKQETKIYFKEGNIWWSHIGKQEILGDVEENSEIIKAIIWDDILLKENKIDFIKVDTEWYEWKVLQWIQKVINRDKPKIIIEFAPHQYQWDDAKNILKFLWKHYSKVYLIEYKKTLQIDGNFSKDQYKKLLDLEYVNLFFYHN